MGKLLQVKSNYVVTNIEETLISMRVACLFGDDSDIVHIVHEQSSL